MAFFSITSLSGHLAVIDNPNINGESDETVPQTNISQTLINTSSSIQTIEYTVTPQSIGCAGVTFQVLVNVKPSPFIVEGPETQDTQCSGSPFLISPQDGVPTPSMIVPVGTQYTWVVSVSNPTLTGWGDQVTAVDDITQTLTNTWSDSSMEPIFIPTKKILEKSICSR